jgi:hypothetical protein
MMATDSAKRLAAGPEPAASGIAFGTGGRLLGVGFIPIL